VLRSFAEWPKAVKPGLPSECFASQEAFARSPSIRLLLSWLHCRVREDVRIMPSSTGAVSGELCAKQAEYEPNSRHDQGVGMMAMPLPA